MPACPRAGVGFKPQHFEALMDDRDAPAFVEVHAENYMGAGGIPHAQLTRIRERMPVSLHGVGLSIGAESAPDATHMDRLAALIERYQPAEFSEHLAWSTHDGRFLNDLLPLSYDAASLRRVCDHIDRIQNASACACCWRTRAPTSSSRPAPTANPVHCIDRPRDRLRPVAGREQRLRVVSEQRP